MRMFLTGMTDLFLILYLTAIASSPAPSVLTVEDFYKLTAQHASLKDEKVKVEQDFRHELELARQDKETLASTLAQEQARVRQMEESVQQRDVRMQQIDQDLQLKNNLLQEREQQLAKLDQTMKVREDFWKKQESSYKAAVDTNEALARRLEHEAQTSRRLAEQMQEEALQAEQQAEEARATRQKALDLKEAAIREKEAAEQKAREAEAARLAAMKAAKEADRVREEAEKKTAQLLLAIDSIKADSAKAYQANVQPLLLQLDVAYTYQDKASERTLKYTRELSLIPVGLNGGVYVFVPYQHIGFSRRNDMPPADFKITCKGRKITRYLNNKNNDLIAVPLPWYTGKVSAPHPSKTEVSQYMPVLLSVRNRADLSIGNLFRGLSGEYFVVNRDNIQAAEGGSLKHFVKGFRGTGKRAERILQGDQLVDLEGRFIGIAKEADQVLRMDSLDGWEEATISD